MNVGGGRLFPAQTPCAAAGRQGVAGEPQRTALSAQMGTCRPPRDCPDGASTPALFEIMATRFGTVTARAHIAPVFLGVPAPIEKQPSTRIVGALADPVAAGRDDEIGRRPNNRG